METTVALLPNPHGSERDISAHVIGELGKVCTEFPGMDEMVLYF